MRSLIATSARSAEFQHALDVLLGAAPKDRAQPKTKVVNRFRRLQRKKVNYSAIAREMGVTPQHVRRVALGLSTSQKVLQRLSEVQP